MVCIPTSRFNNFFAKKAVEMKSHFYVTTLILTCWVFITSSRPTCAQTGMVALSYDLKVGDVHQFKLTTDQHIVSNRAIRVQSILTIEVIDEDNLGNYQCRVNVKSDTRRESSDTVVYRPHGGFLFAGYRLYSESSGYDAVIDALGKVIMGQSVAPRDYEQSTLTAFSKTTDVDITKRPLVPYSVIFSIPKAPDQTYMEEGREYIDTIYVLSTIQPITESYGPTHTVMDPPRNLDTIIRSLRLDSIVIDQGRKVGYLSSLSIKHTISGERYTIITQSERDMSTGLVRYIDERSYFESPKGPRLEYVTTCRRYSSDPFDPLNPRQHGGGTNR